MRERERTHWKLCVSYFTIFRLLHSETQSFLCLLMTTHTHTLLSFSPSRLNYHGKLTRRNRNVKRYVASKVHYILQKWRTTSRIYSIPSSTSGNSAAEVQSRMWRPLPAELSGCIEVQSSAIDSPGAEASKWRRWRRRADCVNRLADDNRSVRLHLSSNEFPDLAIER